MNVELDKKAFGMRLHVIRREQNLTSDRLSELYGINA